jgi:hypothetical protein
VRIPVAASAEFPNDNPELHDGAIWVCLETCARAVAVVETRVGPETIDALVLDLHAEPITVVATPADDDDACDHDFDDDDGDGDDIEVVDELEPLDDGAIASEAPFAIFVRTLAEVAVAAGGADAAALVTTALAEEAIARAWRAILNGESEDFAACGQKPLDEWASELVARLVSAPSRAAQLRRELRARGVAAFGLVLDAA